MQARRYSVISLVFLLLNYCLIDAPPLTLPGFIIRRMRCNMNFPSLLLSSMTSKVRLDAILKDLTPFFRVHGTYPNHPMRRLAVSLLTPTQTPQQTSNMLGFIAFTPTYN